MFGVYIFITISVVSRFIYLDPRNAKHFFRARAPAAHTAGALPLAEALLRPAPGEAAYLAGFGLSQRARMTLPAWLLKVSRRASGVPNEKES